jgi:hypothetical protein
MLSEDLLDQAASNLTTLELPHSNRMRAGTRKVLWSDGKIEELEAAARVLAVKHMPPRHALDQLASIAELPKDQSTALGQRLKGALLVAWSPSAMVGASAFRAMAEEFKDVMRLSRELCDALDELSDPMVQLFEEYCGSGYDGLHKQISVLERFGAYLQKSAHQPKRKRGRLFKRPRASLEFVNKDAWHFNLFVKLAYEAALDAGGKLSANKNNIEEGSLPKFVECFRPYLPKKLVPHQLSAATLARIKNEVDSEYGQVT